MTNEKETLSNRQRSLIMITLMLGGFIALLDETILNVAFAQLETDLHVPISTIQWLATAYMLIIGILVPVVAFLLKTFPTKTMYLAAMLLYTLGTVFCGFSASFPALLVSRMVQASGAGMLMPIMINTIMEIYPPAKRGAALGMAIMVVVAAPAIGPTLSGLILQYLDWHWLFFLILPFALLAMIMGTINLKNVTVLTKPKIDIPSVVLSTVGFGGLIFGVCSIESRGILNAAVLISLVCGIGGLILFSKRQFVIKQPMLELRVFGYPMFTVGSIMIFITFMMPFAVNIILPTYMQSVLGLAPFAAGLAVLPGCMISVFTAPLSGILYDKFGAKPLLAAGFSALTVAMFFLSHLSESTNLITMIILQACMSLGTSFIVTPTQTNSLNQLPKEYNAHGVAILTTVQQVAAAFGSSLFIGLMGVEQAKNLSGLSNPDLAQKRAAMISGADTSFTVALVFVLIGFAISFLIKRREKMPSEVLQA